ncbi:hypothetical protein [Sulfobacillus harzensis]|nr:hypothetical protein [Sulfobacillus harzensis]
MAAGHLVTLHFHWTGGYRIWLTLFGSVVLAVLGYLLALRQSRAVPTELLFRGPLRVMARD